MDLLRNRCRKRVSALEEGGEGGLGAGLALEAGEVSITFLSRLTHHDLEGETGAEAALANLLAR